MPNYDYECETCGKRFEIFQSMKDAKLETCPDAICGKQGKVRRLLGTGGGIIFKGGGFYQTDYRSASYQSGAKRTRRQNPPLPPRKASRAPLPPMPLDLLVKFHFSELNLSHLLLAKTPRLNKNLSTTYYYETQDTFTSRIPAPARHLACRHQPRFQAK